MASCLPVADLRATIEALHTRYEQIVAGDGGGLHIPSWLDHHQCSGDVEVRALLARYSFVPSDGEHALLARLALLEAVVDRVLLIAAAQHRRMGRRMGWLMEEEPVWGVAALHAVCDRADQLVVSREQQAVAIERATVAAHIQAERITQLEEEAVILREVLKTLDPKQERGLISPPDQSRATWTRIFATVR